MKHHCVYKTVPKNWFNLAKKMQKNNFKNKESQTKAEKEREEVSTINTYTLLNQVVANSLVDLSTIR